VSEQDPVFFVRVTLSAAEGGGTLDVTESVTALAYEDSEKKADTLKLTVDNFDLASFDQATWRPGNTVEVVWGYPGNFAPARTTKITSVKGGVQLSVECKDPSTVMNKVTRVRTFENMKRSEVAKQIADEYGYTNVQQFIDDSEEVLEQVTQARMSDAQLLADMARREGMVFFVDFDGFHWHARKLGQPPVRTFRYYTDRVGDILSWTLDNDIYARKAGAVKAKGLDPASKGRIDITADGATSEDTKLGPQQIIGIDQDSGASTGVKEIGSEHTERTTEATEAAAKRAAAGMWSKNQLTAAEITLECRGDPQLIAKTIIAVEGIGRSISGNYYVMSVAHKVGSGYLMTIKARRDGRGPSDKSGSNTSGNGTGAGENRPTNNQTPPADTNALTTKTDQETGETTYVDGRGRTQDAAPPSPGDKGKAPAKRGSK
jgi:phage protein D